MNDISRYHNDEIQSAGANPFEEKRRTEMVHERDVDLMVIRPLSLASKPPWDVILLTLPLLFFCGRGHILMI